MGSFEKQIIESIFKVMEKEGSVELNAIITDVFPKKLFFLRITPKTNGENSAIIIYNSGADFNKDILAKLIQLISLIQYLIDKKYLIEEEVPKNSDKVFGEYKEENIDTINYSIQSELIRYNLHDLASYKFYVSYKLYEFYDNDFQSSELKTMKDGIATDKQIATKNLRWLIVGIFSTFFVGLLNLFIPKITLCLDALCKGISEIIRLLFT
ncbi:MAG: hypothetical protein AB7V36_07175 [Bacteroidales bacterium]